jgi:hypothetical protein
MSQSSSSISIELAQQLIRESQAKNTYNIFIPSLNKTVPFLPMTVAQQMTMSKYAIDDNMDDFFKVTAALMLELSNNAFKLTEITELDRIIILSNIHLNNSVNRNAYKIKCVYCNAEFIHEIQLADYVKSLESKTLENKKVSRTIGNIKYEVELSLPSVKDVLERDELKISKEDSQLLYIKNITINDQSIENFNSVPMLQRITFLNSLSGGLVEDMNICIKEYFSTIISEFLIYTFTCPGCGKELKDIMSVNDFFLN